ncbi:HEPN domain-containing protein [bacterium]|nr:HEPN domain-containing protein [bacterium]MBU1752883.1 HEPN domain-containing protein [bacterium]
MVDKTLIQEWLNKADEDFGFALRNLDDEGNTFYAQICFHFQQSAEKYLKAYIVAYELPFKKIHELSELLRICQEHDDSFSKFQEECDFLTDFYIDTRYPVHWPTYYTQEEAMKSQESANRIGCFVKTRI